MNKRTYNILKKRITMSRNYYPETFRLNLVVNAPWTFSAVWSVVQGWLDEKTRATIKIVKGDPLFMRYQVKK